MDININLELTELTELSETAKLSRVESECHLEYF